MSKSRRHYKKTKNQRTLEQEKKRKAQSFYRGDIHTDHGAGRQGSIHGGKYKADLEMDRASLSRMNYERRKKLILELVEDRRYVPMKEKELAMLMQVKPEDRDMLKQILEEFLASGYLEITRRGRYQKPAQVNLIGIFRGTQRGFGFLEVEGEEEDYFIPESGIGGALPGDTVEAKLLPGNGHGKRKEVEVHHIIQRGITQLVGRFEESRNYGFVVADDKKFPMDIFVPREKTGGARNGQKVVVELTDYGSEHKSPEGIITEVLGDENAPGVDILSIVKAHDLPTEFPERVLNQAVRVAKPVSDGDRAGRLDLRDLPMITIDGEDAKDLDDAVSLIRDRGLYQLGVHIADVTNYVQENSALDHEALKRSTSVYLTDRVIPMLPQVLSNGICSLNAGEDRLALSCLMWMDEKGEVQDYQIRETLIHVNRRMDYNQVKRIIQEQDPEVMEDCKEQAPMLLEMDKLAHVLREKRHRRGAIDFDFPEAKIILNAEGDPVEIKPYERNRATRLIEDFMLAANECVAQHMFWQELPFLYRVHEKPDMEKIQHLQTFLSNFGYFIRIKEDEVHPRELQKLLEKIEGTPQEALISRLTLRSMKRASYSVENSGHFGLAADCYTHFTSPIRRYPDLQIHRILKEQLRGRLKDNRMLHYKEILPAVARTTSEKERAADDAERETDKMKKAQYMEGHIGEVYEGVISGMTAWGMYVELPNTVEGLIPVAALAGDFYYYDETNYEMVGPSTGIRYKLGEKVRVKVTAANRWERTVDFALVSVVDEN